MIKIALSLLGLGRKFPLVSGLLLFSAVGFTYNFFENRGIANDAVRKAQSEAILKDTKENQKLSEEAQTIIERAKDATDKTNEKADTEIKTIKGLGSAQCLDVKLSDLGLQ